MYVLTKRADQILKIAKDIAQEYQQKYVGTEHVLLALLREGSGEAAKMLAARGLTEVRARQEVDRLIKERLHETWVMGRLPGIPHFKNILARAQEEARGLGNWQIGSLHLLLALLGEKGCTGHNVLRAMGITTDDIRKMMVRVVPACPGDSYKSPR
ncbi:MAG TPA: Clp protease N-terminal domain-containing protein [Phycisphaerae bacterium]|nr:Clp protease N-terminal domain-containing protein [Phycisphaerae bacterium]HRY68160.1 Clp protease N-terminal domain-containing protein [Phycisphaerae bacterium]HSA27056.1 Clp protease N-terminal domain-containing protein [Phycisphaerae bacterium]